MVYIRQDKLPKLNEYKYSGVDHSLLSRYVLKPFYTHVVIKCFPMWMAPNLVSLPCMSDLETRPDRVEQYRVNISSKEDRKLVADAQSSRSRSLDSALLLPISSRCSGTRLLLTKTALRGCMLVGLLASFSTRPSMLWMAVKRAGHVRVVR